MNNEMMPPELARKFANDMNSRRFNGVNSSSLNEMTTRLNVELKNKKIFLLKCVAVEDDLHDSESSKINLLMERVVRLIA